MASFSFPFIRRRKLNQVYEAIFEGLQIFVNAPQSLVIRLNMVNHITYITMMSMTGVVWLMLKGQKSQELSCRMDKATGFYSPKEILKN
jgi:hypothetical protein